MHPNIIFSKLELWVMIDLTDALKYILLQGLIFELNSFFSWNFLVIVFSIIVILKNRDFMKWFIFCFIIVLCIQLYTWEGLRITICMGLSGIKSAREKINTLHLLFFFRIFINLQPDGVHWHLWHCIGWIFYLTVSRLGAIPSP